MSIKHYKKVVKFLADKAGYSPFEAAVAMAHPKFFWDKIQEDMGHQIIMVDAGEKKIAAIKEVRALTGLGLKEAKELVDRSAIEPTFIASTKSEADSLKIKKQFNEIGCIVTLKPHTS